MIFGNKMLSNLGAASGFGFPRAKQYQPLQLIESLLLQKYSNSSRVTVSSRSGEVIKYRSSQIMATRCSMVVSNCGSFVKPGGVYIGNTSHIGGRAALRLTNGGVCIGNKSHNIGGRATLRLTNGGGGQGWLLSHFTQSCIRTFSSSCYSDGSLSAQELPSLALSDKHTLKLLSGACYLPHPAKEETGGEDAHFICADEQAIGLADGVGGWADVGVNAGEYARELMSNAVEAIRKVPDDVDPFSVLEKAHAGTNAMGSSTACIIALKNQDLHAINLGDSGFIIVRDGSIIFESPVQQHGFNFTYQLERGNRGDLPSSGQVFKISVVPGDVVIAGSDGLFDNLYAKEVAAIVGDAVKEKLGPNETAQKIAAFARVRALDTKHETPFSTAARQAGFAYYGGKLDDLTVVVSYVSS